MAGGPNLKRVGVRGPIVVNADDFGMSESVNRAILWAFEQGLISRASVMANMPGFEEACEIARRYKGRIGIHLNLSEGRPLTAAILKCPRFCDKAGRFLPRRRIFLLSGAERRAVREEFQAQVEACLERGLQPGHLDSHHHYHTEWPVGSVVIGIARQYGINFVRLSRNCGPGINMAKRLYKTIFNARLRLYRVAGSRYFGSLDDVRELMRKTEEVVEVMVHPRMSNGRVTDFEQGPEMKRVLWNAGIEPAVS